MESIYIDPKIPTIPSRQVCTFQVFKNIFLGNVIRSRNNRIARCMDKNGVCTGVEVGKEVTALSIDEKVEIRIHHKQALAADG